MAAKKPRTAPTRLTREEWLARALEAMACDGRGWIGIHELVEHLGVTKGSFYWHFKDREEFVKALLDFWVESSTQDVAREVAESDASAEERLLKLAVSIVEENLDRYNLVIRAWALREPAAAAVVKKVERFRREYVQGLFREIGFRGDDLEMRTQTFYVFYSYQAVLRDRGSKAERLRRIKLRHRMLVEK